MSNLFFQFSTRSDGNMRLGDGFDPSQNRQSFLARIGLKPTNIISAKLDHGNRVTVVNQNDLGQVIDKTDGLIVAQTGVFLAVTVADCLPVVLYQPDKQIIALLHVGWQGLAKGIIKQAVSQLEQKFGLAAADLSVSIGPGIGVCHYEVQPDFLANFIEAGVSKKQGDKVFFDLKITVQNQLLALGVAEEKITVSSVCTYCQADKYFSFRKDKTKPVEAMLVVAGLV
ncbi:MAG: peptidoglycan editing factor PgeF [Patescibacteria group bacterium]